MSARADLTDSENWFLKQLAGRLSSPRGSRSTGLLGLRRAYRPFLERYCLPLHSAFSFDLPPRGLAPAQKKKLWLLRDGVAPLAWFFANTSARAPGLPERFLVHGDLAWLVDGKGSKGEWSRKTLFYRTVSKSGLSRARRPRTLLLAAGCAQEELDFGALERLVSRARDCLGKTMLARMDIEIYHPPRARLDFDEVQEFLARTASQVRAVRSVDWARIWSCGDLSDTVYAEADSGWLFKDSYLEHVVLAKGAVPLTAEGEPCSGLRESYPLSNFHEIRIFENAAAQRSMRTKLEELQRFYRKLNPLESTEPADSADDLLPWPAWHGKACRGLLAARMPAGVRRRGRS